ncbi:endonuclease [Cohnella pontilimi]|uniref:Endonuclease n=1 Tax=Cohnella pontilimi TaxID=2564100 RepID=A0A4U0FKE0_9BACL|nr:endonuclease/exonuclease/phosphatase family protein [Cohnella pontilimi]TJY44022.1 endonuclease [Cohnella pontilimi]
MPEVKVMLYNMHHGVGSDGKPNLERIVDLVRETGADLIGFNEVDRFFSRRSGYADQFGWFCEQLQLQCAFGASITRKKGDVIREYGNALFSRFPILSHRNHGLRSRRLAVSEPRALLEAEIDLGNTGTAKIFLTHLSVVPLLRRIQSSLIAERLKRESGSVILMGDMNMTPGSGTWRGFSEILTDTVRAVRDTPLFTFPSIVPLTQKDYIFTSSSIRIENVAALSDYRYTSDHLPLLATLRL